MAGLLRKGAIFLLISLSFAFQEKEVQKWLEKLKGVKEQTQERAKEFEKEAKKLKEITHKRAKEYELKYENGKLTVKKRNLKTVNTEGRIYIFMSSSIPKQVWYSYVQQIVDLKLNAVLVLRGCIGGCKYIKPTLEFIHDVLTLGGKQKEGIPVQIWIDPTLFRKYKVKVVPCVAMEGKEKLSCGDWNLKWHLEKLKEGS